MELVPLFADDFVPLSAANAGAAESAPITAAARRLRLNSIDFMRFLLCGSRAGVRRVADKKPAAANAAAHSNWDCTRWVGLRRACKNWRGPTRVSQAFHKRGSCHDMRGRRTAESTRTPPDDRGPIGPPCRPDLTFLMHAVRHWNSIPVG
jgi:hypothetical protein